MTGRYPHAARARDERAHAVIQDAVDQGYLDSGRKYQVPGLKDHDTANQTRLSIARGLEHFGLVRAAWVTDADGGQCYTDCKDPAAPHGAAFELHSKNRGRHHIAQTTEFDPGKMKYDPRASRRTSRFDDDGKWIP